MGGKHGWPNVTCFLSLSLLFFYSNRFPQRWFLRAIEIEENFSAHRDPLDCRGSPGNNSPVQKTRLRYFREGKMVQFVTLSLYFSPLRKWGPDSVSVGTRNTFDDTLVPCAYLLFGIFNASHLLCTLNLSAPLDTGYGIYKGACRNKSIRPRCVAASRMLF